MADTKQTAINCIANMVKAMGDKMTPKEANQLLNDLAEETKLLADKEQIPIYDAARKVAKQAENEQKLLKALAKRQAALDVRARFNLVKEARKGKTLGDGLFKALAKTYDQGKNIGNEFEARFYSELSQQGMLDDWHSKSNHRAIFDEIWELSYEAAGLPAQVGRTGNAQALAVARVYQAIKFEANARKNAFGANIENVPGHVFKQTTSDYKLRKAGAGGIIGKENKTAAYRAWRTSLDSLNLNWDKIGNKEKAEEFFQSYFNNVYDRQFSQNTRNQTKDGKNDFGESLVRFNRGGSLTRRLNAERVLWFADAESAFKYNEMWGNNNVPEALLMELKQSGRNIALLQNMGTKPDDNLARVIEKLVDEARTRDNSQQELGSLVSSGNHASRKLAGMMDLVTGRANATHGLSTAIVDTVKSLIYTTKGTGIIFSALTDKGFIQSRMAYEGFSNLDKFGAQLDVMFKGRPEIAKAFGIYNHSHALATTSQYMDDVKPLLGMHHLAQAVFKYQGINRWTFAHQEGLAAAISHYGLGQYAAKAFDELPPDRIRIFQKYDITPKEWDVIRSAVEMVDDIEAITPESIKKLPDEQIAKLISGKATQGNLERSRALLETKLSYYVNDAVNDAMNMPTGDTRYLMTWGGQHRGTIGRELAELVMIFKGFPIKAAMATTGRIGDLNRTKGYMSGTGHALALIAETAILGYIGMTAKDWLSGKTRKQLTTDGKVNWDVVMASIARGGGLGIYTDFLFAEYDRRYKSFVGQLAGPALNELDTAFGLASKARSVAFGDEKAESLGLDAVKALESNIPLINMFPLKPVFDNLIWWHLKEAISPGIMRRRERIMEKENHQEYWVDDVFPQFYD